MASSTDPSQVALFVLQKVACIPSALGSLMIISQVCRSEVNRKKTQQRLVLGISVANFAVSIVWIFTNFFMPPESGALYAMGNKATCEAQGFLVQFFLPVGILYMCALQLRYLLVIKYGWKEWRIRKIEKWFHLVPILFGAVTAVAALVLNQYNPANWDCWIAPLPEDCTSSSQVNRGGTDLTETDCVRGNNANTYRWVFFFGPLWAAIAFCIFVMIKVYNSVKETELKSSRWKLRKPRSLTKLFGKNDNSQNQNENEETGRITKFELTMTNEVKKQSILYACSFFIVWGFPTIARFLQIFGVSHNVLVVLSGTFIGSQGVLNAIIYFRPRYNICVEYDKWYLKVWALVHSTLFFCCYITDTRKSQFVDYTKDKNDIVDAGDKDTSITKSNTLHSEVYTKDVTDVKDSGYGHNHVAKEEKYHVTQKGLGPRQYIGEGEEKREGTSDDSEDTSVPATVSSSMNAAQREALADQFGVQFQEAAGEEKGNETADDWEDNQGPQF